MRAFVLHIFALHSIALPRL